MGPSSWQERNTTPNSEGSYSSSLKRTRLSQHAEDRKVPVVEAIRQALDMIEQDSDQESSTSSSPLPPSSTMRPPLDLVSTSVPSSSETNEDDCASVVSDMSCGTSPSHSSSSHRSIFQKYWDKNGVSPPTFSVVEAVTPPNDLSLPSRASCDEDPLFHYEQTLSNLPCYLNDSPSKSRRRNIFGQGCWSKSEPSLDLTSILVGTPSDASVRKSNSASMLDASSLFPHRSCLRRGRFSSTSMSTSSGLTSPTNIPPCLPKVSRLVSQDSTTIDSECGSNVSFSRDVNVVVFHPPAEIWAPKGWSQWFGGY